MSRTLVTSALALLAGLGPALAAGEKTPMTAVERPPIGAATEAVAAPPKHEVQALPAEEARRLQDMSVKAFGIKWAGKVVAASDRGFEDLSDGATMLSYRPSGNAWFVESAKGRGADPGFQGSDDQLIARGKEILRVLGADPAEIAEAKVLQQFIQTGQMNPATGAMQTDGPQKDRRTLLITRAVKGLPVWSSRLTLDLDRAGGISALEISWPKIDPKTLETATALQRMAGANYKAPERKDAKLQSAQAGILHSPAASFVDDQVAAIRLIYAPTDNRGGMKPLVYVGVDGRPVAIPRQMVAAPEGPPPSRGKPTIKTPLPGDVTHPQ
jgi:hypothetical protein